MVNIGHTQLHTVPKWSSRQEECFTNRLLYQLTIDTLEWPSNLLKEIGKIEQIP